MILTLEDPALAARWCAEQRERGQRLGFVPTMGALHEGHLSLIEAARSANDVVCCSVFVNPLQFNERSDYERYPRQLATDARLLDEAGCALVFTGTLASFFPRELRADGSADDSAGPRALRDPGPCAQGLEGDLRPGHFAGVATIVARLFEITHPRYAYFGQKDYQQTLVVRDLARRLGFPEIVVCPTSREPSGLARSSRNQLLSPDERERATVLVRALRRARDGWRAGLREAAPLRETMLPELALEGVRVEYAEVRDARRWTAREPGGALTAAIALVAARIGAVRLIDNLRLDEQEPEEKPRARGETEPGP